MFCKAVQIFSVATLLLSCEYPVAFVTQHGIEVAIPAPPPTPALIEGWTDDLLNIWQASECTKLHDMNPQTGIHAAFEVGLPIRLYWQDPPMSTGRFIQATTKSAFMHELAHALIDGYNLEPWNEDAHHALMCNCALPVAETVCAELPR